jgi:protease IV
MKDFFKFMFASMFGFFLTSLILFFLLFGFFMALISFTQSKEVVIMDKTILHLKFDYPIDDRASNDPFSANFNFEAFKSNPGLNEILKNIEKAKNDDRIKGIFLDLMDVPSGLSTITEIRNALIDFKTSGKFIYTYGEMISQKAYYLATTSDKIYINPVGMLEFRGFRGDVMFIKGLLEKLEIEPQIIRHGKYKSAIEPLILDKMSEANKEQTLGFIQSMWDETLSGISQARNIQPDELNRIADHLEASRAEDAYILNLVDSVIYYDQFLSILSQKIEKENINKEDFISLNDYNSVNTGSIKEKRSKNKIAVIFASGSISQGEGDDQSIGSDKIARTIRKVRLDNSIKAVVLRVNSPGGDGIASDIILREVNLTKTVKPVVVSMGDYAASGGYYIACGANKIFAQPNTITGSIGVFGVIPNFQKFLNNKLGITFDEVKTNENADFIDVTKPMSEFQFGLLQKEIDNFYATFIGHVSVGRNIPVEKVDEIGQGRVWSGSDALKLGLVDELGGLNDAVISAAELAAIEDYRIIEMPTLLDPIEKIINDLMGESSQSLLQKELGVHYKYYQYIKELGSIKGIQARLPFAIEIN